MDARVADLSELLSDAALAQVRAHPQFPIAAEHMARGAVDQFRQLEEPFRSILKDVGTGSIALLALAQQHSPDGLTAASLLSACVSRDLASRGRVRAFLDLCFRYGQILTLDRAEPWTRRKLSLHPGLITAYRERFMVELGAISILYPELEARQADLQDEQTFLDIMMWIGVFSQIRPDVLLNHASNPPMEMFVHRAGGMLMLFDLMLGQAPGRARLLEVAPISRYGLAKRYGVSRIHVARTLADAEAQGLMSFPSANTVVFTPKLSDALEAQTALLFQWIRASVIASQRTRANAAAPGMGAAPVVKTA